MTTRYCRMLFAGAVCLAVLLLPLTDAVGQEIIPRDAQGRPAYAGGEVLVEMKRGLGLSALNAASRARVKISQALGAGNGPPAVYRLKLNDGERVSEAVQELAADPAVKMAGPNYYNYPLLTPDDYDPAVMWGQALVGAPAAWDIYVQPPLTTVIVAVIDTGVDYTHPDLAGNMWTGNPTGISDLADGDSDPYPVNNEHGTHVAGTVAAVANNGFGVPGMAFNANIMALKVFPDEGAGALDSDIIAAIDYAAANGTHIANMSLGRGGPEPVGMASAIASAISSGVLFVIAAGNSDNDNDASPAWPSNFADATQFPTTAPGVISVAASDQGDQKAGFSNFGLKSVSIAAPGVGIRSTVTGRVVIEDEFGSGVGAGTVNCADDLPGCFAGTLFDPPPLDPDCTGTNCQWGWTKATPTSTFFIIGDMGAASATSYQNSVNGTITSQPIDTSGTNKLILRYFAVWDLQCGAGDSDYVDVEVSTDGTNWTTLTAPGWNVDDSVFGSPCPSSHTHTGRMSPFFSGGFLLPISHDISGFAGAATQVRFTYNTDASANPTNIFGGFQIVGITLDKQETVPANYPYVDLSGTSMASPLVAGIAAMLKESNAALTPAQIKTRILESGDAVSGLTCRVSTGTRVNALNAISGVVTPSVDQSGCSAAGGGGVGSVDTGGGGGCLITYLTEDYLPDRALDPLRRVRDFLWAQGSWGQLLVRGYYRASAAILGWLEGGAGTAASLPAPAMP